MSEPPPFVFSYPSSAHVRQHGPCGYTDYKSFKPWLRDEFRFQCVFCLCRERWFPDGDASFSVEHFLPKTKYPHLACDYSNLLLACCACNSAKSDNPIPIDPCKDAIGHHLAINPDGEAIARSPKGQFVIDVCLLNRRKLREYRERKIALWKLLNVSVDDDCKRVLSEYFAYPCDLPDLSRLVPPGGNKLPDGIKNCCRAKQERGELESIY